MEIRRCLTFLVDPLFMFPLFILHQHFQLLVLQPQAMILLIFKLRRQLMLVPQQLWLILRLLFLFQPILPRLLSIIFPKKLTELQLQRLFKLKVYHVFLYSFILRGALLLLARLVAWQLPQKLLFLLEFFWLLLQLLAFLLLPTLLQLLQQRLFLPLLSFILFLPKFLLILIFQPRLQPLLLQLLHVLQLLSLLIF